MAAASKPCTFSDLATMSTSVLRLQNTMPVSIWAFSTKARNARRLALGSEEGTLTSSWVMLALVVAGLATSIRTGSLRNCLVRRVISGGMVAEKNRVCFFGGVILKMRSMSGMKPMSSMRSASSTTRNCTPVIRSLPRSKWSSRRPGVAISTSTPRSSFFSWSPNDTPPISSAHESLVPLAYFSKLAATWSASSRVGAMTRARGMRALARPDCKRSISGRVKAAVLPVPVWAMPSTSWPARATGMAWA